MHSPLAVTGATVRPRVDASGQTEMDVEIKELE